MNPTAQLPPRIAAIDLGTNSVRLTVAELDDGDGYRVLDDEREQTRLGYRLRATGRIDDSRAAATLEALKRMKATADAFGAVEIRAVATAALRDAENGPSFAATATDQCGLTLEIISPEEEADLAVRSVRRRFALDRQPAAIADLGGGSMEVVFTTGGRVDRAHSMPLGAVVLTEQFVSSDPLKATDWVVLRDAIDLVLDQTVGDAPFPTPDLIGSGGTFTTIATMAMHDRAGESGNVQGYSMTLAEFEHQLERLKLAPLAVRQGFPGLSPDRADIIVAGAAAVSRLARHIGAHRILVNDLGIRDGVLLQMASRLTH